MKTTADFQGYTGMPVLRCNKCDGDRPHTAARIAPSDRSVYRCMVCGTETAP